MKMESELRPEYIKKLRKIKESKAKKYYSIEEFEEKIEAESHKK